MHLNKGYRNADAVGDFRDTAKMSVNCLRTFLHRIKFLSVMKTIIFTYSYKRIHLIYTRVHTYVLVYIRTYVRTYAHTCMYIRTYLYTYVHTYVLTHIHVCTYVCMCMYFTYVQVQLLRFSVKSIINKRFS